MSYLESPSESDAAGDTARLYEEDRNERGYVANLVKVFGDRPEVYRAWAGLNRSIKAGMDPRRYELATLAAAARLRSSYCSLAHGKILAERHLAPQAVADLMANLDADGVTALDRAIMELADRVAAGACDISADDLVPLRELGLSDPEILDIILAAAARCFFSSVLEAVGAEPDEAYAALDPELRDALTVGRPIAQRASA